MISLKRLIHQQAQLGDRTPRQIKETRKNIDSCIRTHAQIASPAAKGWMSELNGFQSTQKPLGIALPCSKGWNP